MYHTYFKRNDKKENSRIFITFDTRSITDRYFYAGCNFFVVILLISTGIGIFLGIIQLEELGFYELLEAGIILIFAGILTPKLKRQNYSLNLRDGGAI